MISEKFNTDTVAVYDYYTIRKRKTEEMPQIKEGIPPLLPSQVKCFFFSLPLLEINKWPRALGSKSTLIRLIGQLSDMSACILEKKPLSVSSVASLLLTYSIRIAGDHHHDPINCSNYSYIDKVVLLQKKEKVSSEK